MTVERRKNPRISVAMVPVKMETVLDAGKTIRKGIIKGISAGGIGIEMQDPFSSEDIIALSFVLDTGYKFDSLKGRVVRVADGLDCSIIGVEFTEISEEDRSRMKKYVSIKLQEKNDNIMPQRNMVIFK